jgi:hypothetical protein
MSGWRARWEPFDLNGTQVDTSAIACGGGERNRELVAEAFATR